MTRREELEEMWRDACVEWLEAEKKAEEVVLSKALEEDVRGADKRALQAFQKLIKVDDEYQALISQEERDGNN